jgi:hypothetical protein
VPKKQLPFKNTLKQPHKKRDFLSPFFYEAILKLVRP